MSTHRAPCTDGDVCGDAAHCPPEFPSDAQGPVAPESEPLDLDAIEREIGSIHGADRTTCRALVSEIRAMSQICARHSREAWDEGFTAATDAAPEDVWPEAWNYVPNPYWAQGLPVTPADLPVSADQKSHAAHHGPDCACLLPERARAEAERQHPSWHDRGVGIVQASHWRSGFVAGAAWAAEQHADLRGEVEAALDALPTRHGTGIDGCVPIAALKTVRALLAGAGEQPGEAAEPVCDPWAACPVHGDQHWREHDLRSRQDAAERVASYIRRTGDTSLWAEPDTFTTRDRPAPVVPDGERYFKPVRHTTLFPPPEPGEVPHPICSECSHVNAHDPRCSRSNPAPVVPDSPDLRERAWDEGYRAGARDHCDVDECDISRENPYRAVVRPDEQAGR